MDKMIYSLLSVQRNPEKLHKLLVTMKGIAGADLYELSSDEITAIVSDINRASLITDRSTAIEFAGVIEILSQQFALLPVRFASIMESADSIIKMLDRNNHNILQNLHNVENKYEYGLKIFCEPEKLMSELSLKSEVTSGISATPAPRINNSIYREWVNNKLKEHKAEELLVKYVDSVIAEITLYLGRLNAVSKIKKMTTATTIIDVALLLDKTKKEALVASVEDLQNQHAALTFVLTGPWPPYNFVEFTVK